MASSKAWGLLRARVRGRRAGCRAADGQRLMVLINAVLPFLGILIGLVIGNLDRARELG